MPEGRVREKIGSLRANQEGELGFRYNGNGGVREDTSVKLSVVVDAAAQRVSLAKFKAAFGAFVNGDPMSVLESEPELQFWGGWCAVGTGAERES